MLYLRYKPISQNLWAVSRHRRGRVTKIAEVTLSLTGVLALIPIPSYALSLDELQSITAFMGEAHKKDSAIVLTGAYGHTG